MTDRNNGWHQPDRLQKHTERQAEIAESRKVQPTSREDAQPVAWSFELATVRDRETGEYSSWSEPRLSFTKPCVSEGSIRNLTALGPITHPGSDALRVAVEKVRDQYKDQMRFCDIEPLPYFREFVRRIDAALQAEQGAALHE